MGATRPKKDEIFHAAADIADAVARAAFLASACGDDTALRAEIERLLEHDGAADSLLDRPGIDVGLASDASATVDQPQEQPGAQIGPYKLLEVIGQGGMGVVYRAEQREPIERQVALKIIKPGMDTAQVIARFDAERQALARMDHPSIAKVLDAGVVETGGGRPAAGGHGAAYEREPAADRPVTSPASLPPRAPSLSPGRPYFVMELVPGIPITEYCDQHELSIRARLELFVLVCQAVQHAHQKGVIHRDLKPSNILVVEHEERPLPKVIDFGVAKATGGQLTDKTAFTSVGQLVGTPLYMSPEQAGLGGQDVDTRTDVYALGVLLYELLTGEPPLDKQRFRDAAYEEIRRVIREEEPSKPSTRISALGEAATTASGHRRVTPALLRRLLEGELDWIVMKALEKDRTRRYETASACAKDIQRYLNNEPVEAGPPSAVYRLRKFARRHKAAFVTTSLVAASLVVGIVGTTWQALRAHDQAARAELGEQRAEQEAEKAKTEAAISQAVNEFLTKDLLAQADPENEPDRDIKLRTVLDRASANTENRFADQPLVKAAIHKTLGDTYLGLGENEEAERHYEKAREIYSRELGPEHLRTLAAQHDLALTLLTAGRLNDAIAKYEETLKASRGVLGPEHSVTLATMKSLADAYREAGRLNDALPLLDGVVNRYREELGATHRETLSALNSMACAYSEAGQGDKALPILQDTLKLVSEELGPDHPRTLSAQNNLAIAYADAGRTAEAVEILERVVELNKARLGPGHRDTLISMRNLADTNWKAGRWDESLLLLEESLRLSKERLGPNHADTLRAMGNLADMYWLSGRLDEAVPMLEEAFKVSKETLGPDHPATIGAMKSLGDVYREAGRLQDALPLLEEAWTQLKKQRGPNHSETLSAMNSVARALQDSGRKEEALSMLQDLLTLVSENRGPDHPDTLQTLLNLAVAYRDVDRLKDALPLCEKSLELRKAKLGPTHPATLESMHFLGMIYLSAGRPDEGIPLLEETLQRSREALNPDHPRTLATMRELGTAYVKADRLDQAIPVLEESLQRKATTRGATQPDTLAMSSLAAAYLKSGQSEKAIPLIEQFLSAVRKKTKPHDPEHARLLASIGLELLEHQQYAATENYLRECLSIRERTMAGNWLVFNTKSMLGGSLAGQAAALASTNQEAAQKNFTEAEGLLIDGYEGMKAREETIPVEGRTRPTEALKRLVDLYTAWGKPDEAARWQQKLDAATASEPQKTEVKQ